MKTVRTFSNLAEAGFCSSLLEASGVRAFVAEEQCYASGYGAAIGPLRVQVEDNDFERAIAVLKDGLEAGRESDPNSNAQTPQLSAQRGLGDRSVPWAIFVVPIAAGLILYFAVDQMEKKRRAAGFQPRAEEMATRDTNDDGRPDETFFYRRGILVRSEADRNFDGKPDAWFRYGRNEAVEESSEDRNRDGKPNAWFVFENGTCVSGKEDLDFNGVPDSVISFEDGSIAQRSIRPNETGAIQRREFYQHGELREEQLDRDGDGTFDVRIRYDVFGNRSAPMPIAPAE